MTRQRDRGASAVEYGKILAAITALIVTAVFAFGSIAGDLFRSSTTCLQSQGNVGC